MQSIRQNHPEALAALLTKGASANGGEDGDIDMALLYVAAKEGR